MTEPDFPYPKRNFEAMNTNISKTPPAPSLNFSTLSSEQPESKFVCPKCKKAFKSNEELALHMETTHQSPKKKL